MPTTIPGGGTHPLAWKEDDGQGPCFTCPAAVRIAGNLNLLDHAAGETGSTPVNAHLETGADGKRTLVLS